MALELHLFRLGGDIIAATGRGDALAVWAEESGRTPRHSDLVMIEDETEVELLERRKGPVRKPARDWAKRRGVIASESW